MNHSCNPNVRSVSSGHAKAVLKVKALRNIAAGEEICIDYFGFGSRAAEAHAFSAEQRREILQQTYFFECQCPACQSAAQQ